MGVSLITINSDKGFDLLLKSSNYFDYEETERNLALASCRHLDEHPIENPDREDFFKMFFEQGYYATAKKYIVASNHQTIMSRLKGKVKRLINRIKK